MGAYKLTDLLYYSPPYAVYNLMEGDLHTLSRSNIMFKYADDTNLLQWYWLILTYNI